MAKRFSREEISQKGDNIYAIVKTLSQRAIEIARGGAPLILRPQSKNPTNIALEEFMENKLTIKTTTVRDDRSL